MIEMARRRTRPVRHKPNDIRPRYDRYGRPTRLREYWNWLLVTTDTEPVEAVVSLYSLWWGMIAFGLLKVHNSPSPVLLFLESIISLRGWVFLLFSVAILKLIGLVFRLDLLRALGLLGSVGVWLTICGATFRFAPISPTWGGYAILAVASGWAFLRLVWEKSDSLIDYWRAHILRNRADDYISDRDSSQ